LDQAQSKPERQHWIQVRSQTLQVLLDTFPPHGGREDHYDGTPYPAEQQLLRSTAELILQLGPEDDIARFWKPVLSMGAAAQYWVADFVIDFLTSALEQPEIPPGFVPLWSEMIQFTSASPAWRRRTSEERLWLRLLGIDPLFADL
jgi:hypothetical protein